MNTVRFDQERAIGNCGDEVGSMITGQMTQPEMNALCTEIPSEVRIKQEILDNYESFHPCAESPMEEKSPDSSEEFYGITIKQEPELILDSEEEDFGTSTLAANPMYDPESHLDTTDTNVPSIPSCFVKVEEEELPLEAEEEELDTIHSLGELTAVEPLTASAADVQASGNAGPQYVPSFAIKTEEELQEDTEENEMMEFDAEEEMRTLDEGGYPSVSTDWQVQKPTSQLPNTVRSSQPFRQSVTGDSEKRNSTVSVTSPISSRNDAGATRETAACTSGTAALTSTFCGVCVQRLVGKHFTENTGKKSEPPMHFCGICGHIFYGSTSVSEGPQTDPLKQYATISAEQMPDGSIVKNWLCNVCHQVFWSEDVMRVHLTGHDVLIPLSLCEKQHTCRAGTDVNAPNKHSHICTKCSKSFKCTKNMGVCSCGICGEIFTECHSSKKTSSEEKPVVNEFLFNSKDKQCHMGSVTCELCGKSFVSLVSLKDHSCEKKLKSNVCNICKQSFSRVSTLRVHKLEHLGLSPHSCELCGKHFLWACRLKTHKCKVRKLHKMTMKKPLEHDISSPKKSKASELLHKEEGNISQKYNLSKPLEINGAAVQNLKDSKPLEIKGNVLQKLKGSKPLKIKGDALQKLNDSKSLPKSKVSKPLENKMKASPKLKECKPRKFQCKQCGLVLSDHIAWKKHKESHLYRCGDCGKAFRVFDLLQEHMCKINGGYMCHICEKVFTSGSTLKSHTRTHTQERPYPCDICGRRFTRSNLRKVHRRTHTGETPHVCRLCGKSFDWPCRMKKTHLCHQYWKWKVQV